MFFFRNYNLWMFCNVYLNVTGYNYRIISISLYRYYTLYINFNIFHKEHFIFDSLTWWCNQPFIPFIDKSLFCSVIIILKYFVTRIKCLLLELDALIWKKLQFIKTHRLLTVADYLQCRTIFCIWNSSFLFLLKWKYI